LKPGDWATASYTALAIVGMTAAAVLVASFVLDSGSLSLLPECPARRAGGACALCGLSHSFVAISHGRLKEALAWNPMGPWVYAGFVLLAAAGSLAAKYTTLEYLRNLPNTCKHP
jgi:Protein of unknown function (DUF2752)